MSNLPDEPDKSESQEEPSISEQVFSIFSSTVSKIEDKVGPDIDSAKKRVEKIIDDAREVVKGPVELGIKAGEYVKDEVIRHLTYAGTLAFDQWENIGNGIVKYVATVPLWSDGQGNNELLLNVELYETEKQDDASSLAVSYGANTTFEFTLVPSEPPDWFDREKIVPRRESHDLDENTLEIIFQITTPQSMHAGGGGMMLIADINEGLSCFRIGVLNVSIGMGQTHRYKFSENPAITNQSANIQARWMNRIGDTKKGVEPLHNNRFNVTAENEMGTYTINGKGCQA